MKISVLLNESKGMKHSTELDKTSHKEAINGITVRIGTYYVLGKLTPVTTRSFKIFDIRFS